MDDSELKGLYGRVNDAKGVSSKATVRMEEYFVIQDPYTGDGSVLFGEVHDHSNVMDGHRVITSPIMRWIDPTTVETRNTIYVLGKRYRLYEIFMGGFDIKMMRA